LNKLSKNIKSSIYNFFNQIKMENEKIVQKLIRENVNNLSSRLSKKQITKIKESIEFHEEIIKNRVIIDQEDLTKAVVKL